MIDEGVTLNYSVLVYTVPFRVCCARTAGQGFPSTGIGIIVRFVQAEQ